MNSTSVNYLYTAVIACSEALYSKEESVSISFTSSNPSLSYRDVRREVINRVPEKYTIFKGLTYNVGEV